MKKLNINVIFIIIKQYMIISLLVIPLIGILLLLPINSNSYNSEEKMKKIALSASLINLLYLSKSFDLLNSNIG